MLNFGDAEQVVMFVMFLNSRLGFWKSMSIEELSMAIAELGCVRYGVAEHRETSGGSMLRASAKETQNILSGSGRVSIQIVN